MTRDEVADRARSIVAAAFNVDPASVTPEARFKDDLGGDSVDVVEMLMEFQERLGVAIPDEDAEGFERFGDAVDYLAGKLVDRP